MWLLQDQGRKALGKTEFVSWSYWRPSLRLPVGALDKKDLLEGMFSGWEAGRAGWFMSVSEYMCVCLCTCLSKGMANLSHLTDFSTCRSRTPGYQRMVPCISGFVNTGRDSPGPGLWQVSNPQLHAPLA